MTLKTLEGKDLFAALDDARSALKTLEDELSVLEDRILDADKRLYELETIELPAAYDEGKKSGEEEGFKAGQLEAKQERTEV